MKFPSCEAVILQGEADAMVYLPLAPQQAEELQGLLPHPRPTLVALHGLDWNGALSPWPAKKVFKGGEDFAGGADAWLEELTQLIIPAVEVKPAQRRILAGYSLGGLFAVYAALHTPVFHRVASVSGSMWYDGFVDYALARTCLAEKVYLSLGDREKLTRNPRMARVEDCTRAIAQHLGCGVEMNPGGHFQDELPRMAKAIGAMMAEDEHT